MISTYMWFGSGLFTGVIVTLSAKTVYNRIKMHRNGRAADDVLTMEKVTSRVSDYLSEHSEMDSVAVSLHTRDNIPAAIVDNLKDKLSQSVQYIVILVAVKDEEPKKTIAVFLARELEVSLQKSLESGVLKIER